MSYNINILQFVLNDFREKIEQHSTELVNLLIQKDELETEQDSMLIDIEDISHSSLMWTSCPSNVLEVYLVRTDI